MEGRATGSVERLESSQENSTLLVSMPAKIPNIQPYDAIMAVLVPIAFSIGFMIKSKHENQTKQVQEPVNPDVPNYGQTPQRLPPNYEY
ncbi:hypothetical protein M8J76_015052 [Diaphorina citri]|nr:hypothetical protein M8J76_015052 [Diaphorina citri]